MPHKVNVSTSDLKIGMFVSDLDRPWIELPFLMEGVLLEKESEIATLQEFCKLVIVDRNRSIGNLFSPVKTSQDLPNQQKTLAVNEEEQAINFADVCRQLRKNTLGCRPNQPPPLNPKDQQSRLEAEMLYSAPLVDDVKNTLKSIREALSNIQSVSFTEIGNQVADMARAVERNPDAMIWLARLRSTDQYSYDHALDVSIHLMVFARFLGLPGATIEILGLAGLMQDIGKVNIPTEILSKPGDLTEEEYELVKSHVASSLEILYGHKSFATKVLEIVASHHERADGSGYPRRLKGERIGFNGELAGVVDSYCAMTRDRAYGPAISSQKAMEALVRMRGGKFRDAVVDQFIQCIGLYPIGSLVELNTGEVGVVIQQNQVRRLKPSLLIILAPDKTIERHPITLDLIMDPPSPTGEIYRIVKALPANAYGINPSEFYLN